MPLDFSLPFHAQQSAFTHRSHDNSRYAAAAFDEISRLTLAAVQSPHLICPPWESRTSSYLVPHLPPTSFLFHSYYHFHFTYSLMNVFVVVVYLHYLSHRPNYPISIVISSKTFRLVFHCVLVSSATLNYPLSHTPLRLPPPPFLPKP